MAPIIEKFEVKPRELMIAAATGAIFGLLGYYLTRHIHNYLDKVV